MAVSFFLFLRQNIILQIKRMDTFMKKSQQMTVIIFKLIDFFKI